MSKDRFGAQRQKEMTGRVRKTFAQQNPVVDKRNSCAVCGYSVFETVIDLPNLPLTGTYSREAMPKRPAGIDQQLLVCMACGHAQLMNRIEPDILYGDNYSFRTSRSLSSLQGVNFFMSVLDEILPNKHFRCVMDIGCNDLYLLAQLKGRAKMRVGVDPLWAGKEEHKGDKDIILIGATVEDMLHKAELKSAPDLIICRHTLEHIWDPQSVLTKFFEWVDQDAVFLFEVPDFDDLVNKLRFDQVFHQHLQYFTLISFKQLLSETGGIYLCHRERYHPWGTLLVGFTKRAHTHGQIDKQVTPGVDIEAVSQRYALFRRQLSVTNEVLNLFEGTTTYGYGASQMLSVLAYHLDNDLSLLTAVLDDDPAKDGLYYWNLPLVIHHTSKVPSLENASIFITAVDYVKPILRRLLLQPSRHIIYPFHIV